ncbi:MAG: AI-2E family transporter YdiK [Planctomycetes bacterium]|nr:AI-2E family transporter YdiK [Planctomycetota bacterium]
MTTETRPEIARTTLAVLSLGLLILGSLWILRPFLAAGIWATTIAVTTWPLLIALERRFGGSRRAATATMTMALLLLLILPVASAVLVVVAESDRFGAWGEELRSSGLPRPPEFVRGIPGVGESLAEQWEKIAAGGPEGLAARLTPYADDGARWMLGQIGHVGTLVVQFLITVVLAALIFARGEVAAEGVLRFGRRLAGERGEAAMRLAASATRAVALGVGITALLQTAFGGIGLLIAGVPFAGLLTALMLLLCIAQLGPTLVLAPATVWLFWKVGAGWGTLLLVWTIVAGTMDNVIRPVLIKRGADLPLLLIFGGVIGGLLSFGLIGLFVGPVILAVSYRLLAGWVAEPIK